MEKYTSQGYHDSIRKGSAFMKILKLFHSMFSVIGASVLVFWLLTVITSRDYFETAIMALMIGSILNLVCCMGGDER